MQAVLLMQQQIHVTWIDAVILTVLALYAVEGYGFGVVYALFDFVKFFISFLAGLKGYAFIVPYLMRYLHMSKGYANAAAFFIVAVIVELMCHVLLKNFVKKVNKEMIENQFISSWLSNFLGIFPGILSGIILLMFLLTVITALPVSPFLKNAIASSQIGSFLVDRSQVVERELATIFGGAANDTINFLTVEPQVNTSISLGFTVSNGEVDGSAEEQMLIMINDERVKRGEQTLVVDQKLKQLAEYYGQYLLSHGYFSHYTPDGLSPFDRMSQHDIIFQYAGENLAFSANTDLAMQGLMNSPGHRANILSANFRRVGIGVINAGIYGEMFVQEFTD